MGANSSTNKTTQIKVGTLNYSGILKSPYEFYEKEDKQEYELSKKLEDIYNNHLCQYSFGPLDKDWQQLRYSPLYVFSCGLKNNVNILSKKQFEEQWEITMRQHDQFLTKIVENHWRKEKERKGKQESADKGNKVNKSQQEKTVQFKAEAKKKKKQYLDNMRNFDFLVYKSILETIYTTDQQKMQLSQNFEKCPQKFQLDSRKYRENRKDLFVKPFLNEKQKINKTIKMIKEYNLDILFVQEADLKLVKAIQKAYKQLRVVRSWSEQSQSIASQSIIIIRENKQKFPKFKSFLEENKLINGNTVWLKNPSIKPVTLTKQEMASLNLNRDTVIQCLYNIILISVHLSSKKQQNMSQVLNLKKTLVWLKNKFPECHIILGGDLNSPIVQTLFYASKQEALKVIAAQFPQKSYSDKERQKQIQIYNKSKLEQLSKVSSEDKFNIVPKENPNKEPKMFTVNKKRTWVQAQPKKSNQLKQLVIDYIISDFEIKDFKIGTLAGPINFNQKKQPTLLPSSDHPYDHYLLTATIVINEELKHTTDLEYKYKYEPTSLTKQELEKVNKQFIAKVKGQMQKYYKPSNP